MVEVSINQIDAGTGPPVAQQTILNMFRLEGLLKQHIIFKINLGRS
jgi:hypothetical protein